MKVQIPIALIFYSSSCLGFAPNSSSNSLHFTHSSTSLQLSQQPSDWGSYSYGNSAMNRQAQQQSSPQSEPSSVDQSEEESLKGNRWSQFAPDANLPNDEFRAQLKENMKADLERRRREDPNRGNQPAKSYLDSL